MARDLWLLENSPNFVFDDHEDCPDGCALHHRTNHHMRKFRQRYSWGKLWRVCPHGFDHPDPDDFMEHSAPHLCCEQRCCVPVSVDDFIDDLLKAIR